MIEYIQPTAFVLIVIAMVALCSDENVGWLLETVARAAE